MKPKDVKMNKFSSCSSYALAIIKEFREISILEAVPLQRSWNSVREDFTGEHNGDFIEYEVGKAIRIEG
ncbi:hypothetical protein B6U74_03235 [Candidatus Bathyarchaeota archaeon ex4484_205]|nr:MAG: hypothetical protein B6U74_03235 [Candidatus Bathyarchaeota archaeon ex4484_205]RLG68125.1 MAG: hypothetical protein DRN93_03295 [archaeon]